MKKDIYILYKLLPVMGRVHNSRLAISLQTIKYRTKRAGGITTGFFYVLFFHLSLYFLASYEV
jgi:hypothetical protein